MTADLTPEDIQRYVEIAKTKGIDYAQQMQKEIDKSKKKFKKEKKK